VGPTAIAFVTGDPVAVAKSLRDFAKTSPNLVVKGGLLGKKVLTAAEATALADVAPRDVVLAQLAGALAAPLVKMAGLLQALPRNFAYGLKALLEQKAATEPPAPPADEPAPAPPAAAEAVAPESSEAESAPATEPAAAETESAPATAAVVDTAPADEPAPADNNTTEATEAEPADAPAASVDTPETDTTEPATAAPDAPATAASDDSSTDIDTTPEETHTAPEATDTEETQES